MSTVVITPTHIACDHMVVDQTIPHESRVDTNHMKIFVHPENKFLFSLTGNFDPAFMQTQTMFDFVEMLLSECSNKSEEHKDLGLLAIEDKTIVSLYLKTLPKDHEFFIVTDTKRYALFYIEKYNCIAIKIIGDIHGVGTGGPFAVGLLRGGMSIYDIWETLNTMERTSSVAHTIIPLSILKGEDV